MAVYSMTGYASATAGATSAHLGEAQSETGGAKAQTTAGPLVSIELRSVNGRFLDLGFRLSDEFRALEPALRDLLGAAFRRGKIELRLGTRSDGTQEQGSKQSFHVLSSCWWGQPSEL